ncbi:MAG TPA: hypothetical protein VG248_16220, partial [Caulobacteraceae bacterium]|nr:hypothetical protein [Caulobacteraceae bacterium]
GLAAATAFTAPALAAPAPYRAPAESLALKPGAGANLTMARCAVCHSVDYIATQPPRTVSPRFWDGEVSKMIKTFGAPVDEADRRAIVDYLNLAYGAGATPGPGAH